MSVGRPGASLVLRPPRLFRHSLSPVDRDPDPVTDPVPDDPSAPAPASVPSYPSITVDDHPCTKHVKRLELVTPEDGELVMS